MRNLCCLRRSLRIAGLPMRCIEAGAGVGGDCFGSGYIAMQVLLHPAHRLDHHIRDLSVCRDVLSATLCLRGSPSQGVGIALQFADTLARIDQRFLGALDSCLSIATIGVRRSSTSGGL